MTGFLCMRTLCNACDGCFRNLYCLTLTSTLFSVPLLIFSCVPIRIGSFWLCTIITKYVLVVSPCWFHRIVYLFIFTFWYWNAILTQVNKTNEYLCMHFEVFTSKHHVAHKKQFLNYARYMYGKDVSDPFVKSFVRKPIGRLIEPNGFKPISY